MVLACVYDRNKGFQVMDSRFLHLHSHGALTHVTHVGVPVGTTWERLERPPLAPCSACEQGIKIAHVPCPDFLGTSGRPKFIYRAKLETTLEQIAIVLLELEPAAPYCKCSVVLCFLPPVKRQWNSAINPSVEQSTFFLWISPKTSCQSIN